MRKQAWRQCDYAPDGRLKEYDTEEAFLEFEEDRRQQGPSQAKYESNPRATVPTEQLALESAIAHAVANDGNETRVQLASVEDGMHERFDGLDDKFEALRREMQQNLQARPDQLQMMVELSAPSVTVSILNGLLVKANIACRGSKVQKARSCQYTSCRSSWPKRKILLWIQKLMTLEALLPQTWPLIAMLA